MKKLLITLCALALAAPAAWAQKLSADEAARATDHLKKSREALIKATRGLSDDQWSFKPAPNRWSVAEVVEHLAAAEGFLRGLVTDQVLKTPAASPLADAKATDDFILQAIAGRSKKAQAPEPLMPTKRYGSPAESLKQFKAGRAQTLRFLKSAEGLRQHAIDSPLGRKMDGYHWMLMISAHTERHTKQINEVKADPGFPKKKRK